MPGKTYRSVTPAQLQQKLDEQRQEIEGSLEVIRDALGVGQINTEFDGGNFDEPGTPAMDGGGFDDTSVDSITDGGTF